MPEKIRILKCAVFLIFCSIGFCSGLRAQDGSFSQSYMNPVYLNPAYTGSMKVSRMGVQYRNQWPGFGNAYTSYFATFDAYIPKISSGLGFYLFNDLQGNGIYSETSFRMMYSKEIRLNRYWTMYGSLSAGGQMNSLNFNQLIFQDGIDLESELHIPSNEATPESNSRLFPDFGTGLLFFNEKYFFGFAADHLTQPDQSLYSAYTDKIPAKFTFHLEMNLPWFHPGHWRKYLKLNPNFVIQSQGREQSYMYGIYANRKGLSLGLWNRFTNLKSNDMIVMVGFMGKQFKTAVSYDMNVKGVGLRSHGAVEISISWLMRDPGEKSVFPFYEIPGEWDIK